ncbi:MAG TPA: AAA family ATPase, partial [Candidatus Cryosericum sp.]
MKKLQAWKEERNRKPLIIRGARQVGKTWLMKEFGRTGFQNVAYVNFDNNPRMQSVFDGGYDTARLVSALQIETSVRITPEDTLIIFDEVQEVPKALTSLKYFNENAPEYAIVAAGSLLGV